MIKLSEIKKNLPKRAAHSHKGQNGRVLVVGGSVDYFGAPILAAMAAMRSGADLVMMAVPECNFEVSRSYSASLIVGKYGGDFLNWSAKSMIETMAMKADVVLIGNGIGERPETMEMAQEIIENIDVPCVIDAHAIGVIEKMNKFPLPQPILMTPHHTEFEKLTGKTFKIRDKQEDKLRLVKAIANDLRMTIVVKGPVDTVVSEKGEYHYCDLGNPGMTAAGTGDVLSGLIAGLMAQKVKPFDAGVLGTNLMGKAAEKLVKTHGLSYGPDEILGVLPGLLKDYIS